MAAFLPSKGEVPQWEEEEEEEDTGGSIQLFEGIESERACENGSSTGGLFSSWNMGGLLDALARNRVMNQGTLDPVLDKIKRLLISKNVAIEVSADGCHRIVYSSICTVVEFGASRRRIIALTSYFFKLNSLGSSRSLCFSTSISHES